MLLKIKNVTEQHVFCTFLKSASSTSGLSFTLCEFRVRSGHVGVVKRFISYFTAAKGGISSSVLRLMRAMADNET